MKALSLRQPWAWAVLHLGKTVENRVRNMGLPKPSEFLIHASLHFSYTYYEEALSWMRVRGLIPPTVQVPNLASMPRGVVIGMATSCQIIRPREHDHPEATNPWWMEDQYGYVLTHVRATPLVPLRAYLGFFTVPDEVADKAMVRP